MPRKPPPPPDPRAVKRDERRLVGIAAKPAPALKRLAVHTEPPKRGGRK